MVTAEINTVAHPPAMPPFRKAYGKPRIPVVAGDKTSIAIEPTESSCVFATEQRSTRANKRFQHAHVSFHEAGIVKDSSAETETNGAKVIATSALGR